jgi:dCTP deaminase
MSTLTDREIVELLQPPTPLLSNFSAPHDWYAKDSFVQPSSLDLHVGNIFVPPKDEPKANDAVDKRIEYTLQPGQAAVVDTLEELNLPSNIMAFGFPPTSISNRAVLMTNPGHIDPGYRGKLGFTLINMGREPFVLTKGKTIVTLLMVKLAAAPNKDFIQRNPSFTAKEPSPFDLYRLGRDFLDFDQRARKAVETIIREEHTRTRRMEFWVPVIVAFLSAAVALGAALIQSMQSAAELKQKISELENQIKMEPRLKDVETKVNKLTEGK